VDPILTVIISAGVAGLVAVLTSERRIDAENVIQDRKNWREEIRKLSSTVFGILTRPDTAEREGKLRDLRAEFALRLNPHEIMDQQILQLIAQDGTQRAEEFIERVELLLKFDWERAKRDASLWRRLFYRTPKRVRHECFRRGDRSVYRRFRTGAAIIVIVIGIAMALGYYSARTPAFLSCVRGAIFDSHLSATPPGRSELPAAPAPTPSQGAGPVGGLPATSETPADGKKP